MYEELIQRLIEVADEVDSDYDVDPYNAEQRCLAILQAAEAIEELEKAVLRWIPVTERLPEKEKRTYWICTDTGYQCECRWTNNRFGIGESDEWCWSIADVPQYHKVVAWMFLPEPYEPPKEET